ncbi:PorT family protein [Ilyomonas limi]|uniref:PorT family protein n=1 Tax=Ilyomonas limi TaxID=2575867 RepID=A0A4U3L1J3_9BACT|nr:porin family protein [Ilyomonas limi]TKK68868.1 PorT family protein [Ilyomonas limi]
MKKLMLLVAVGLATVISANAQRLDFGGKIGANLTKIDGVKFSDSYKLNYQLGAFAEIDFNKNWGIQPELLFSQTTSRVDSGFSSVYQEAPSSLLKRDVKLNYLSIPILLRINAGSLLTFHVGPQFSVLVNDDENLFNNGKDAFKKGDLSAVLGAQINISKLRIYGRYNVGLANISDVDNPNKWKTQQLQLGVGFKIL